MDIRAVADEPSYDWALAEVDRYFADPPEVGSMDSDHFDVLVTLIAAYEARVYPVGLLHPLDAIEERLADKGMSRRQLCATTGIQESKLSEVLSRKLGLSLSMIRAIAPALDLPVEVLVQAYPIEGRETADV